MQRDNKVLRELKDYDMKNTKVCPKCGSCDVVVVPGGVGGTYVGNNVHIGFFARESESHDMCVAIAASLRSGLMIRKDGRKSRKNTVGDR